MFITLQTLEGNKNKTEKIRRQKFLVQAFASNGCTVLGKPFNISEHEDSFCEGEKDLQTTKPTNDQYLDYVENSQNSIAEKENSQNMGKRYKETFH